MVKPVKIRTDPLNATSEYDVLVWNENKGLREGWKISELKAKDMERECFVSDEDRIKNS